MLVCVLCTVWILSPYLSITSTPIQILYGHLLISHTHSRRSYHTVRTYVTILGVLGAPFPYLVGIHSSFLTCADCVLPHEGALIDLDKNIISYGRLGPPPLLPDKRCRKLHQLIISSAPAYGRRGTDWRESRLPLFDSAFTVVTDSAAMECEKSPEGLAGLAGLSRNSRDGEVDEVAVRAGFLNFFVAILKNYRRCVR